MQWTSQKRSLIGTGLGRSMLRSRQLWELWRAVHSNPEAGPSLCQDFCVQSLLPGLCDPRKVFVDAGAHIGSVIGSVRHRHPRIRVIAFEADPVKAAALGRRLKDVDVHPCALGEKEGEVTFFVDTKRPGYSSLSQGLRSSENINEISVPMRRMDGTIAVTLQIEVIKMDVEGAELGVLRGSSMLIQRCRPIVLFESALKNAEAMGFTVDGLFDWFRERDYEIFVPNRVAHDGPSLSRESFLEAHYYPCRTRDYFAILAQRRTEFRDRARETLGAVIER
jgi:FkbM family methyltransferase